MDNEAKAPKVYPIMNYLSVQIADQTFHLMADKTIYWPLQRAILLADTHFGKAATFRNRGIPVPVGTTDVMLDRLTDAIARTDANQIFFLGDFVHSYTRYETDFEKELRQWRNSHSNITMTLVMGNHDRGQRALFHQLGLKVVEEPFLVEGLALCHYPETPVSKGVYKLAGHLHPSIRIVGSGDRTEKIPCFHFGAGVGVLPAYGEFTGTQRVTPMSGDRVFAVAEGEVIEITTAAGIS
jgi:DNA ligase-associated metallophosphoesterase